MLEVSADSLNARVAPTIECETDVITLTRGTVVSGIGTYGDWVLVEVDDENRWVNGAFVIPHSQGESSDQASNAGTAQCPLGGLVGQLTGVTVGPPTASSGFYYVDVTATGVVVNGSNASVALEGWDVPDVKGYASTGEITLIDTGGKWDGRRSDEHFVLDPGSSASYTVTIHSVREQIERTAEMYSAPELGSFFPTWMTRYAFVYCASPAHAAGIGVFVPVHLTVPAG